jgi:hypothetical protein
MGGDLSFGSGFSAVVWKGSFVLEEIVETEAPANHFASARKAFLA